MGLMDKFKNLFTDEEIIEEEEIEEPVKIKEIKNVETKEHKLPTFMREKIEKEEKNKKDKMHDNINKSLAKAFEEKDEVKVEGLKINQEVEEVKIDKKPDFKFPVFDESDFVEPTRTSRHRARDDEIKIDEQQEEIKEHKIKNIKENLVKTETKVSKLYKDKITPKVEDKRFKATPIISPIFGVLDKNYVPDDVATRQGDNYEINRHSKNIDFDSVRKKAYGDEKTLEEDINDNLICENCEYLKKAKFCKKKDIDSDNIMYEALCENKEEEIGQDITIDEATENYFDYGTIYEKKQDIDPIYLDDEEDEEVNIVNHVEEKTVEKTPKKKKKDVPPVKSSINLLSTIKKSMGDEEEITKPKNGEMNNEKDLELTDDLFNLIDSMYEERDD